MPLLRATSLHWKIHTILKNPGKSDHIFVFPSLPQWDGREGAKIYCDYEWINWYLVSVRSSCYWGKISKVLIKQHLLDSISKVPRNIRRPIGMYILKNIQYKTMQNKYERKTRDYYKWPLYVKLLEDRDFLTLTTWVDRFTTWIVWEYS